MHSKSTCVGVLLLCKDVLLVRLLAVSVIELCKHLVTDSCKWYNTSLTQQLHVPCTLKSVCKYCVRHVSCTSSCKQQLHVFA